MAAAPASPWMVLVRTMRLAWYCCRQGQYRLHQACMTPAGRSSCMSGLGQGTWPLPGQE